MTVPSQTPTRTPSPFIGAGNAPAAQPAPGNAPVPQGQAPVPAQRRAPQAQQGQPQQARAARRGPSGASTPALLTWLRLLSILAILVFGVTTAGIELQTRHAMETAGNNAEQYVRVQEIQASLLSAHANAANGFLLGGNDTAKQQEDFRNDLARTNQLIIEAANAEPADREALAALSNIVTHYTSTIEQAKAVNRQGHPLGQTKLDEASAMLADGAVPLLTSLGDANTLRVDGNTRTISSAWIWLAGLVTLGALLLTAWFLARRTHRFVNLGLTAAIASVLIATVLATSSMATTNNRIDDTSSGSLANARAAASARAYAYNAKAMESLALISRASSGGTYEAQWNADSYHTRQALKRIADPALSTDLQNSFKEWIKVHRKVRDADLGGEYERAVTLTTGTGEGSSNAAFDAFDAKISEAVSTQGKVATESLGGLGNRLLVDILVILGLTLAAAAAAALGIGQRLKEYL